MDKRLDAPRTESGEEPVAVERFTRGRGASGRGELRAEGAYIDEYRAAGSAYKTFRAFTDEIIRHFMPPVQ